MKKHISILIFISILFNSYSQVICGYYDYIEYITKNNPNQKKLIENEVVRKENYLLQKNEHNRIKNADITIPVVVNILYKNSSENISDEIVRTQIDQLNQDFNRLNNQSNVPSNLQIGEVRIEFCLQLIRRKATTVNRYVLGTGTIGLLTDPTQGLLPFDQQNYLNIYVSDLGIIQNGVEKNTLGGFTGAPGTINNNVNVDYNYFGNPGTNATSFGHFTTHEVGHWLGLCHPFDSPIASYCINTTNFLPPYYSTSPPNTPNFNCTSTSPSYPTGYVNDYYMNFMEYTGDNCISMFTQDQVDVMRSNFVAGGPLYSMIDPLDINGDSKRCSVINICNLIGAISNINVTFNLLNSVDISWDRNFVQSSLIPYVYYATGYNFRYRQVGGAWSSDILIIDTKVSLNNLPDGNYEFQIRPIYPLCNVNYNSTSTFVINQNGVCGTNIEPNNSIFDIGTNPTFLIRPINTNSITQNTTVNDRIDNPNDVDWFRVKTNAGYNNMKIVLTPPSILGLNYDLEVYDCNGNLLREAANNPNVNAGIIVPYYIFYKEYIILNNIIPMSDYYIKIIDHGTTVHTRMCYQISVTESINPFTQL